MEKVKVWSTEEKLVPSDTRLIPLRAFDTKLKARPNH